MSTIAPPQPTTSPASFPTTPGLYRFTVDEYERMILDDPRVELIDGQVVKKMPKTPEHGFTTKQVLKALERQLPAGWTCRKEEPVRIPEYDEPEPDVSIAQGSDEDYRHRTPGPADVALVVEVSLSTLASDRGKQLLAYARGGIPVYWIVNLVDRRVEVYTNPGPGGYGLCEIYKPGQTVPIIIGGRQLGQIAVDDILP
jgi:Uma2 family endonuclease